MPVSYATQISSCTEGDSQATPDATQTSQGTNQNTNHDSAATGPTKDGFWNNAYAPLHQAMADSLFREEEERKNSHLAPSNIVSIKAEGNTIKPRLIEPWNRTSAETLRGVAHVRRVNARQLAYVGHDIKSKLELAHANRIEGTLNSVANSHAQETRSPAEIRTDIHRSLVQAFGQSPMENLEQMSFDQLVETYNNRSVTGSKFERDTMTVAFSHLLFALGDKERRDRERQMQEANVARKAREQAWMQQHPQ